MTSNTNTEKNHNHKNQQCPFAPSPGYTTKAVYEEYYINHFADDNAPRVDTADEYALMGNPDNGKEPLYFWQLYSILGPQPIVELITDFYQRVWNDEEAPWFRDFFVKLGAPMEHHINAQAAYWIDAMGGGRIYHGGDYRLRFHHQHNAREIMTAAGATRWMHHMRLALQNFKCNDPRVVPAILAFLDTKMQSYAEQFGWAYNTEEMKLRHQDSWQISKC